jgi:hypothetical protein
MPGDIDSAQILQVAGLATELVWMRWQRKNPHSCQETNLSSNVRQLAGSGIKASYKVQNKLKCQSFVIGHSTPSFSWSGNICLHSSPQTYSYFGQHTTVSNSYLSWITLRVKYHQKTLKFKCFSVFINITDLLTVLMCMKSYLSKHWNCTLKPISWMSVKFGIGSLHWSYIHYISVWTFSAEPLICIWS